ncbi:hypothetical protein JOC93_002949 [Priestia taiwanensis]|nr:hypothetical protein [Priestia taiwanensis]
MAYSFLIGDTFQIDIVTEVLDITPATAYKI